MPLPRHAHPEYSFSSLNLRQRDAGITQQKQNARRTLLPHCNHSFGTGSHICWQERQGNKKPTQPNKQQSKKETKEASKHNGPLTQSKWLTLSTFKHLNSLVRPTWGGGNCPKCLPSFPRICLPFVPQNLITLVQSFQLCATQGMLHSCSSSSEA